MLFITNTTVEMLFRYVRQLFVGTAYIEQKQQNKNAHKLWDQAKRSVLKTITLLIY